MNIEITKFQFMWRRTSAQQSKTHRITSVFVEGRRARQTKPRTFGIRRKKTLKYLSCSQSGDKPAHSNPRHIESTQFSLRGAELDKPSQGNSAQGNLEVPKLQLKSGDEPVHSNPRHIEYSVFVGGHRARQTKPRKFSARNN